MWITSRVAHLFNQQCASGQHVSLSGCVINTCGLIKGARYQALIHAALAFEVDLILALGQDRLYNDLLGHLPHDMRIVFLPKSGGVSKQSKELRRKFQYQQMRDYFYGPRGLFYPHAFEVKFSDVHIYKVETSPVSESCIPMDVSKDDNKLKLVPVTPGTEIAYHLMSLKLFLFFTGISNKESFEDRLMGLPYRFCVQLLCFVNLETGSFFGEVEGAVMNKLLTMGSFKRITLYDYQAMCRTNKESSDSAHSLLDPYNAFFAAVKWIMTELILFLVEFNLCSWWNSGHTVKAQRLKQTLEPCDTEYPAFVSERTIKETTGTIACEDCSKSFVIQQIPSSNLFMVVVDNVCSCSSVSPITMAPIEIRRYEGVQKLAMVFILKRYEGVQKLAMVFILNAIGKGKSHNLYTGYYQAKERFCVV
ncbi:Voltage-dependent calcium channel subunit alpha-2 delta-3 [Pelobates cultripes]|uniref:Voltage-dependent calcium channel subunit alpha-2 delta-3, partial n=1 Tax=Pelobates cultripes TaxID=61616 RepID=A0AAD1WHE7_PELCU|nr:Voltage-dependent calcium channel subunit alpha-2 delta-3 [Pelobates cultripes]